jgi:hypothetical protein
LLALPPAGGEGEIGGAFGGGAAPLRRDAAPKTRGRPTREQDRGAKRRAEGRRATPSGAKAGGEEGGGGRAPAATAPAPRPIRAGGRGQAAPSRGAARQERSGAEHSVRRSRLPGGGAATPPPGRRPVPVWRPAAGGSVTGRSCPPTTLDSQRITKIVPFTIHVLELKNVSKPRKLLVFKTFYFFEKDSNSKRRKRFVDETFSLSSREVNGTLARRSRQVGGTVARRGRGVGGTFASRRRGVVGGFSGLSPFAFDVAFLRIGDVPGRFG